ncbi:sensor histidine kinase [Methanolobus profundi]|uniref:GAF domain-containing protein n=1 Tax=Methanolobus profundi TaxID=487685 RepID=A0A1I4T5H4_9EURY|nr:GAF domain-containing sensor histidine kinase [Methanolobus profundi]SFM71929.1 GAF domain-containing protein [Methanolobus profundi]
MCEEKNDEQMNHQLNLLKKTFSSIQDLIVVIDRDMRIVTSNWKNCDSIPANEKKSNPLCYSCLMQRSEPCGSCKLLEVFATGACRKFEIEDPLDNRTKLIELSPVFDDDDNVIFVVRHAKDISERKSVENILQMREKQQAAVAKLGQEGLAGADLDELMQESVKLVAATLNIEYCRIMKNEDGKPSMVAGVGWEEKYERETEAEKNDIVCYTLYSCEADMIQDNDSQERFDNLSMLKGKGILSGMDVLIGSKEKPFGTMNVHTTQKRVFTKDDMNFVQSVANVLAEALSRKQTEENLKKYTRELEDANYLKVLFTDILTHDLLNPANIIRGFTEQLIIIEDESSKKNLLDKIHKNNEKLIYMIESASKFIKLESIDDIRFEEQDLLPLMKKVIRNFEPEADKKDIELSFVHALEYPSLINPLIEEVVLNLLSNAVKYSPPGGKISINVSDMADKWKIHVADIGPGITDDDKTMIFERFRQADKGSVKGSGLGLAIVKRIVELHGGEVGVDDNPIGRGSVFWFTVKKSLCNP